MNIITQSDLIGYFTILFESVCIISLISIVTIILIDSDCANIEIRFKSKSTWIKETKYYESFPSIDIPMDYSDDKVEISSELKSRRNLRCVKCGCAYIPTPDREPSPSPKYCPECGRKIINWKEIKI